MAKVLTLTLVLSVLLPALVTAGFIHDIIEKILSDRRSKESTTVADVITTVTTEGNENEKTEDSKNKDSTPTPAKIDKRSVFDDFKDNVGAQIDKMNDRLGYFAKVPFWFL